MLKTERLKRLKRKIRKLIKIANNCDGWSQEEIDALIELEKELENKS